MNTYSSDNYLLTWPVSCRNTTLVNNAVHLPILHFPNRLISSLFLKTLGDLPRGMRDLLLVFLYLIYLELRRDASVRVLCC
jgi:hypothetical protein